MAHVQIMATQAGDQLVERIAVAAARLHAEQGATQQEALGFMDKSLATLGDAEGFTEANSGHVYRAAVRRFQDLLDAEAEAALGHA